jgi:2-polyprenyl-6-methoxyphenol hydroxylase-like FAD-dependent oxidoreductase
MAMIEHAVVIAGGGPTGLMLAAELAMAKVDVAIVERRASQELIGLRAGGLHSRTIEVLDQRGIANRFLSQEQVVRAAGFHMMPLDITDFPTRHNYLLHLWQNQIERILAEWVAELPVTIYRGRDVTGFVQDDTGIDVAVSDGQSLRGEYLVGCDGGRSLIRKAAGIAFPGWDPTTSWLIAEVKVAEEPKWGVHQDAIGLHAIGKVENGESARIVLTESQLRLDSEPTLREVSEALVGIYGTDFGIHSPTWVSRFTDMARLAAAYRDRRVLLAGDAAHVHPPMGGQGLNIGVQDAVNLGWKLAQVVKRTSPEGLLDTYHTDVTQSLLACCATRWRRSRCAARTTAPKPWPIPFPSSSEWTSLANGWLRNCLVWASITILAKAIRCSGAACLISTWPPPPDQCASSLCCTVPGRSCSISVSPARSTSLHGRIGFNALTLATLVCGSFRCWAPSLLPPPC